MSARIREQLLKIFRILEKNYGPQHWWPADTPLEVVVGAILTQNTSWKNVEKAIIGLKKERLMSFKKLARVSQRRLARTIKPAGYFNIKAKRLKCFMGFVKQRYSGQLSGLLDIPVAPLREDLLSVYGIGPETADSIILYAANKPAFVVDAYTRRIFSRLGLLAAEAPYEDIQAFFMKNLPAQAGLFNEYHALIVEHAKGVCAQKPLCGRCVLRDECGYYRRQV